MIKIYSWNVNGIRAVDKKQLLDPFIESEKPDIVCFQEIKAREDQIILKLEDYGYSCYWFPADKPGYSGTGVATKIKPLHVTKGIPKDIVTKYEGNSDQYGDVNKEGRITTLEFDKFYVISMYTPNAKNDLSRLDLISKFWYPTTLEYFSHLDKLKPVIITGDLNVAYTEDDLANPKSNKGKKGFTIEERNGFETYLDYGFLDSLRQYKQGNGYYTWWSHFANARARNVGWRIDYCLVSPSLKKHLVNAEIHPNVFGSDHCPVSVTLDI